MKGKRVERKTAGCSLTGLAAFLFFLFGSPLPGEDLLSDSESFLAALLLKTSAMTEELEMDIQVNDRDLEMSEKAFEEAEKRMTNATETQNDQAIHAAREPLLRARSERKRLREKKERLELSKKMAEAAHMAARDMLVSGKAREADPLICGLLSLRSGKGAQVKKDGTKVAFQPGRPGFLEPGDEIVTEGKSAAEIVAFDGRAVVQLDERSRLRLEDNGPQGQVLRLLQGRLYCTVDEADVFAGLLQEQAKKVEADPALRQAVAGSGEKFQDGKNKTFMMRTLSACCSTKGADFSAAIVKNGGTEISVLEGGADAGDAECAQRLWVEHGFRVSIKKDGPSRPEKLGDVDKWWEK
jgi:hypothetical protein